MVLPVNHLTSPNNGLVMICPALENIAHIFRLEQYEIHLLLCPVLENIAHILNWNNMIYICLPESEDFLFYPPEAQFSRHGPKPAK